MNTIKFANTQLKLYSDDIFKMFDEQELLNRKKAGLFLAKQLRKNLRGKRGKSSNDFPGVFTGNLKKSMGMKVAKKSRNVMVGAKRGKGYHAHLLEFGHEPNPKKNMRPFLTKTFKQNVKKTISILEGSWEK